MIEPIKMILQALGEEPALFFIALPLPIIKMVTNYFLFNEFGVVGFAYSMVIIWSLYSIMLISYKKEILIKNIIL